MSGNRPDLHTSQHDQWDQGGYCNNLVVDDDGCGTVCGYHAPSDCTPSVDDSRQEAEVRPTIALAREIASWDQDNPGTGRIPHWAVNLAAHLIDKGYEQADREPSDVESSGAPWAHVCRRQDLAAQEVRRG